MIATVGGLGYAPIASGTVASAAAAALWYAFAPADPAAQWLICAVTTLVGIWASGVTAKRANDHDPKVVVIDEVAGMWITLAGLPKTLPILIAAFALFRLFDIGKWPPMRQLERLHGGLGIMLDDVAAGLIGRLLLALGLAWLGR
ncbi:MAG: phosphatidylglycerophosphatase A [Candidatus Omnitrophica bacterium]|nr:phosphatidylglycerophosphatase A [Candidatus Omnitrophota bacterium]